jgi:NADPH:quinone reductase-like Zn-dependent oxidoreductase
MKQIVIAKSGDVGVLKIKEKPDTAPEKGEVKIRVKASGINFADILARKGLYPDAPKPPCVIGYEVSGIVEAVGEEVQESMIGKSVLSLTRFGGYSDVVIAPTGQVVEKPESLTFEEAAAIPVNYLTAYQLLVVMGSLRRGESVLIHNVGGGVGLAALDIAKKIGAVTYGTASSVKHAFLSKRGLEHVIDYRTQDWSEVLRQLTNGRGVELIIDPLGGRNWKRSYKALRNTGRLGMFGVSTASRPGSGGKLRIIKVMLQTPWFHPFSLMNSNKGVFGVHVGHLWNEGPKVAKWMEAIIDGVKEGWIRPHVDKSFSFNDVADAHTYIENRRNIGKVVLVP